MSGALTHTFLSSSQKGSWCLTDDGRHEISRSPWYLPSRSWRILSPIEEKKENTTKGFPMFFSFQIGPASYYMKLLSTNVYLYWFNTMEILSFTQEEIMGNSYLSSYGDVNILGIINYPRWWIFSNNRIICSFSSLFL